MPDRVKLRAVVELKRKSAAILLFALGSACSGGRDPCNVLQLVTEESCVRTQDCIDLGFTRQSCINGICRTPCTEDRNCTLTDAERADLVEDAQACEDTPGQTGICESQVCVEGCSVGGSDCPNGMSCAPVLAAGASESNVGRCAYYAESFEGPVGGTLQGLGWNAFPKALENRRTRIVFEGVTNCESPNTPDFPGSDTCAGPAADGTQFVVVQSVPASERGSAPQIGRTPKSCACCLSCIANPGGFSATTCPSSVPTTLSFQCGSDCACSQDPCRQNTAPPACQSVCAACAGLMDTRPSGEGLMTCEIPPARTSCPSCDSCDQRLTQNNCSGCPQGDCRQCTDCADCDACDLAFSCQESGNNSARCLAAQSRCAGLGNSGCYSVATGYPREELTDAEQALVSPAIPISGVAGRLVLQFDYISLNVRDTYSVSRQNVPSCEWLREDELLSLEFCAENCETPASWSSMPLVVPPRAQRNNGLQLFQQSVLDWRAGRIDVEIPDSFRTNTFRFRFLPRMDEDSGVGVDNILIRSL
jgi:hypothetical protein